MSRIDAILIDVGGVLLLPEPGMIGAALTDAAIVHDAAALPSAHYGGVASLDAAPETWEVGGAPAAYVTGLLRAAGVPDAELERGIEALRPVLRLPATELWSFETPWARSGLARLSDLERPIAVVSNADGTVEHQLRRHRFAQVGPGPGLEVAAIVDSHLIGVSKPDPQVFTPGLQALGVPAHRCAYIGDTVTYDVAGARAAGLVPVHLDPLRSCRHDDHLHARTLEEAVDRVA